VRRRRRRYQALAIIGNRGFLALFALIIIVLLIDTSIRQLSVFTGGLGTGAQDLAVFVAMILVYAVGQYFILSFLRQSQLHFQLSYKLVTISQYVLIAILASITLQVIFTGGYSSLLMKTVIWINYIMFIALMASLSQRFLSWSRSNRNKVVIAYGVSMAVLSISGVFTILYVTNALSGQRGIDYIRPLRSPLAIVASVENVFSSSYLISSVAGFIFTWFATILLLHHYSRKLGLIRYWVMVLIPLVYFLSQFQGVILDVFGPLRTLDPILFGVTYTLIFSATKSVGGILFGIAFWSVARNIQNNVVKNYFVISAYGMVLLFTANQPVGLTLIPYPPFGLSTISFLGLSAYLVFIGIYSASLSVALDSRLRNMIRKMTLDERKFLQDIGTSEMERVVEKRVRVMISRTQDDFKRETGIETSLTDTEAKEYLRQVLEEIGKKSSSP
jgi:hypothetical protein